MTQDTRTDEAVAPLLLQHLTDVTHAAAGELVVVELVSRGGAGVHDVVPLLLLVLALGLPWGALCSRVMLRGDPCINTDLQEINTWILKAAKGFPTYRGAEVVTHFVCECDVGNFGGYVGGVVLHGDDARVQRLLFPIRVQLALLTDSSRAPCEDGTETRDVTSQDYPFEIKPDTVLLPNLRCRYRKAPLCIHSEFQRLSLLLYG